MPVPAHQPVVVNLDVEIDANGTLEVFGQQPLALDNIIYAGVQLPVRALYDASGYSRDVSGGAENGLFEFWEPSSAIGTRAATMAAVRGDYTLLTKKFIRDLQAVLEGSFDCSQASPFTNYAGAAYTTQEDFGRVALSTYAHYLFGHIEATAAITNDTPFMNKMLSKTPYTDVNAAYKHALAADVAGSADGSEWTGIGSESDAELAKELVGAVVTKNPSAVLAIVEQVLGQDASRAMDQDNNELPTDVRQLLKFIPGDIIYMSIRLQTPVVTVSNGQLVNNTTLENKFEALGVKYNLRIELTGDSGFDYPVA